MSMRSYFTHGYGFTVDKLNIADGIRFLSVHKDTVKEINPDFDLSILDIILHAVENKIDLDDMDEYDDVVAFFEGFSEMNSDVELEGFARCIAEVIGQVIAKESNLPVYTYFAQEDCEGDDCIMIPYGLPWEFDRPISKNECDACFEKYIKELNLDTTPDYLEIESFG